MARWEIRRALRWGSEHMRYADDEAAATAFAYDDIAANGNVGRIEQVDRLHRILYYDVHEELS